jgi:signal peptidase
MRVLAGATTALRRIVDLGLVILIVVVLFAVILGKGAPLVGRQSIVIGGGSMEPAIGIGSAIVIQPVEPAALAVGDVVSLRIGPDRATYTHRIIAVVERPDGRWIRTQGDANAAPDPSLVPATAVIGRVEHVVPFVGYVLALLSLPVGVMFILGLAATLLAIAWLLESLELEPRPARRPAAPVDVERLPGEPIAARPSPLPPAPRSAAAGSARGSSTTAARPTVREQLARSREVRNRRARWLIGRERDRRLAD